MWLAAKFLYVRIKKSDPFKGVALCLIPSPKMGIYANPSTSPRIKKAKYTLCPECRMIGNQLLR